MTVFNANPGKEHKLYGKYFKSVTVNKLAKIVALILVVVYALSVFFTPVFTMKAQYNNTDAGKTVYEREQSFTFTDIWDTKKANKDVDEKYIEDVEQSVKELKGREFTELERMANIDTAIDKMSANMSNLVEKKLTEIDKDPQLTMEFNHLVAAADAVTGFQEDDKGVKRPIIDYSKIRGYMCDEARISFGKMLKVFDKELEARNVDGLRMFLCGLEDVINADNAKYAPIFEELQDTYLVGEYKSDAKMQETIKEFVAIHHVMTPAAMTAETIADYRLAGIMVSFRGGNDSIADRAYANTYVYYGYDIAADEHVFEQNSTLKLYNVALLVTGIAVLAVVAIAVLAIVITACGFITRKYKKLRSFFAGYAFLPLIALVAGNIACDMCVIESKLTSGTKTFVSTAEYDFGNLLALGFVVAGIAVAVAIFTAVMKSAYKKSYIKACEEDRAAALAQASAEIAARAAAQAAAEQSAPEAVAEEVTVENGTDAE